MTLTNKDKLEVVNHCVTVNGRPFVVDFPKEPIAHVDEDGRLVTLFRGHLYNHWEPEDVSGYYA